MPWTSAPEASSGCWDRRRRQGPILAMEKQLHTHRVMMDGQIEDIAQVAAAVRTVTGRLEQTCGLPAGAGLCGCRRPGPAHRAGPQPAGAVRSPSRWTSPSWPSWRPPRWPRRKQPSTTWRTGRPAAAAGGLYRHPVFSWTATPSPPCWAIPAGCWRPMWWPPSCPAASSTACTPSCGGRAWRWPV